MAGIALNDEAAEILSAVFDEGERESAFVDAVSFRADHEDWIAQLDQLEHASLLKREDGKYRVSFFVLTCLAHEGMAVQRERCCAIFDVLRAHYKNHATRKANKLVTDLAVDIRSSYSEVVHALYFFRDASSLWFGGGSVSFDDPATAYVLPSEAIITCKNFDDLIAKVAAWYRPAPTVLPGQGIEALFGDQQQKTDQSAGAQRDLHPCPVVMSFLYDLDSDGVVRIVNRVGLTVNWQLSKEEGYSAKTRKRAYIPRIERALADLDDRNRMLVARNVVHEIVREWPERAGELNGALAKIGWRLEGGELTTFDLDLREMFFPSGAEHTAYVQIRRILALAESSIDIVDPYLDSTIFTLLKTFSEKKLAVRLLAGSPAVDFRLEADKFRREVANIDLNIRSSREFHDRFIVVDKTRCFHVGASVKDAGKRAFMISQLEDQAIASSVTAFLNGIWRDAQEI